MCNLSFLPNVCQSKDGWMVYQCDISTQITITSQMSIGYLQANDSLFPLMKTERKAICLNYASHQLEILV